jgi:cytochrome c oxidase assembly protein subunit 15
MVHRVQAIPDTKQASSDLNFRRRAIRIWLLAVAALVFATLLVGGATRLTESGLSIVEWKPVTGTVPPVSENAWLAEFEKYQATTQYQQLNQGMTLDDFKTIYWWEWTHRMLGRLIGAAFLFPFIWFLWRGWVEPGLKWRLWAIFGLGALQGAVGWWMVASGLVGRVSVSQYRLAFHLTLACVIYAALVWTAQRLRLQNIVAVSRRIGFTAGALLVLVLAQIYLGALVAGLDAGKIYNTLPLIDGALIPSADRLFFEQPLWRNFFENPLMVQFQHRMLAYTLLLVALAHLFDVARTAPGTAAYSGARWLALAVVVQAAIGMVTLVNAAPISLSLLHQGMAIVLLTVAVLHAQGSRDQPMTAAPKPEIFRHDKGL